MRTALVALAVAASGLLAFSTGPVSQSGSGTAFAKEFSADPRPPKACRRYCNDEAGVKFCGSTPVGQNGCDHIVNNSCIYVLCGPPLE